MIYGIVAGVVILTLVGLVTILNFIKMIDTTGDIE